MPQGKEWYELLCTVRNPFFRMPSIYTWSKAKEPFASWVESLGSDWVFYERPLKGRKFTPIRTEHLEDDLRRIPSVQAAIEGDAAGDFERFIRHNQFQAVQSVATFYEDRQAVDAVLKACGDQFELFGYERECPSK